MRATDAAIIRYLLRVTDAKFDPKKHPHAPAGTERGGQFVSKEDGTGAPSPKATKLPRIKPDWARWPKKDREWAKKNAAREFKKSEKDSPQIKAVRDKLLQAGGVWAAVDDDDPHAKEIVTNGQRFSTDGMFKIGSRDSWEKYKAADPDGVAKDWERFYQPGQCHWNAVALWRAGKAVAIGRGYCLGDEGVRWFQHSWGIDARGRILETTFAASAYVGVKLEGKEAKAFAKLLGPRNKMLAKGYSKITSKGPKW